MSNRCQNLWKAPNGVPKAIPRGQPSNKIRLVANVLARAAHGGRPNRSQKLPKCLPERRQKSHGDTVLKLHALEMNSKVFEHAKTPPMKPRKGLNFMPVRSGNPFDIPPRYKRKELDRTKWLAMKPLQIVDFLHVLDKLAK